jgi:hypothetical protein
VVSVAASADSMAESAEDGNSKRSAISPQLSASRRPPGRLFSLLKADG